MRYGFLEHDDYQAEYRTYRLTRAGCAIVAVMNYAGTIGVSIAMCTVWKGIVSGGWFVFRVFVWMPERFQYLRKYVYSILGFGFLISFGLGFFKDLYYLFFLALWLLSWSMYFKYGHLPKSLRAEPSPTEKLEDLLKRNEDKKRHLS